MAFVYALDPTTPAGGEALSLGDDRIREFKNAMVERLQHLVVDYTADPYRLQVTSTTAPQATVRYDASNHLTVSVSSAGLVTLNATGASAAFSFSDGVTVAAGGLTVSAGTTAVQALTATTGTFSGAVSTGTLTATTITNSSDTVILNSNVRIKVPGSGIMQVTNNAENDFVRLQFGGSTAAFPALKRSGAGLIAVLADDSANAAFTCAALTATTGTLSGLLTAAGVTISIDARLTLPAIQLASSMAPIRFAASGEANPGAPAEGDFWYDHAAGRMKYYDGSVTKTLANV